MSLCGVMTGYCSETCISEGVFGTGTVLDTPACSACGASLSSPGLPAAAFFHRTPHTGTTLMIGGVLRLRQGPRAAGCAGCTQWAHCFGANSLDIVEQDDCYGHLERDQACRRPDSAPNRAFLTSLYELLRTLQRPTNSSSPNRRRATTATTPRPTTSASRARAAPGPGPTSRGC